MKSIREKLACEIEKAVGTDVRENDIEIPETDHGDFAYPMMKAASELGENPRELAEKASEKIDSGLVDDMEVAGPGYLNFFIDRKRYAEEVEKAIEREDMGVSQREGRMLIEFSSPNVAKPMHVGHMRNNFLGDALQRIMDFSGYDVTSENYLGDWGTQYGKLIAAFRKWGSEEEFEENPMEHMYELYVKFHEEADEEGELDEEGKKWAARIEEGDREAVELWERFREASIEHHMKDFERMNIDFDRITGESKVVGDAREMVEKWLEEGKVERDDDGSVFLDFDDMPGAVLMKSDGSTLYLTRDLYNLKKRNEEGFDFNLYVVASEQDLHFRQVFAAAEKFGIETEGAEHVSYGMLSLPGGSMSSREGNIVRLSKVMDEASERAGEKAEDRMDSVENSEAIGLSALRYANLSVSRKKDIEFDWDEALSFEGDSGPYLQYSNVRAKSILDKTDLSGDIEEIDDLEYKLLKKIGEFPGKVDRAVETREPVWISSYLSELCEIFNSFYHECPVITEEGVDRTRLRLTEMFVRVSGKGLELLGIEPLDEM